MRSGHSSTWAMVFLTTSALAVSGCQVIEGIFKAGVWVGILFVVIVGGIIAATTGMFRR